jgi:transposase-like protein
MEIEATKAKPQRGRRNTGQEKARAEELFVTTTLSQDRIAQIVGINGKTMSEWVNANDGKWKQLRAANGIKKSSIVGMLLMQMNNLLEVINVREENERFPTSTEADTIAKIAGQIERLEKKNTLAGYIQVMDEFMDFLNRRDPALVKTVSPYLLDFAKDVAHRQNG